MIDNGHALTVELEQATLGALLVNPSQMIETGKLQDYHFSSDLHGLIFRKLCDLFYETGDIPIHAVLEWSDNPDLGGLFPDSMDGPGYIRGLMDSVVTTMYVRDHANQLIEYHLRRALHHFFRNYRNSIDTEGSQKVMSDFLAFINDNSQTSGIKSCSEVMQEIEASLEMPPECHSTGIQSLDEVMGGGLYAGFTYGLCGAEKAGKTTLAHTVSYNLKCPHLYVAMEMGAAQIQTRNVSRQLGINSLEFLSNRDKVRELMPRAKHNQNQFYLDYPGASVEEILHNVTSAIAKHKIRGFIVDYWQLVEGQRRGESEERHLRYVAQSFANFARKHGVWCILLAQMNKDGGLFGGNGLRKACDQLYMIEFASEDPSERFRWLRMDASRYTMKGDVGNPENPSFMLNFKAGPHFEEVTR